MVGSKLSGDAGGEKRLTGLPLRSHRNCGTRVTHSAGSMNRSTRGSHGLELITGVVAENKSWS